MGDILGAAIRRRNAQTQGQQLIRTAPLTAVSTAMSGACSFHGITAGPMALDVDLLLDRRKPGQAAADPVADAGGGGVRCRRPVLAFAALAWLALVRIWNGFPLPASSPRTMQTARRRARRRERQQRQGDDRLDRQVRGGSVAGGESLYRAQSPASPRRSRWWLSWAGLAASAGLYDRHACAAEVFARRQHDHRLHRCADGNRRRHPACCKNWG